MHQISALPRRVIRRARWAAAGPGIRRRQRAASRQIAGPLDRWEAPSPAVSVAGDGVDVLVPHRVHNDDRLAMLRAVVRHLEGALAGTHARVLVADASDTAWSAAVQQLWATVDLDMELVRSDDPMPLRVLGLLERSDRPFTYLQFDDMVTVGLDDRVLDASCALLASGLVDVVFPSWPVEVTVDPEVERVMVVPYVENRGRFRFWTGRARRPVATVTAGGVKFGVFENFTYGFFMNQSIVRREDLASRLQWFVTHVSSRSAHEIELVAAAGRGPIWTHVAVPLGPVAILDLDFSHTEASVRPDDPGKRAVLEALEAGWAIDVEPR